MLNCSTANVEPPLTLASMVELAETVEKFKAEMALLPPPPVLICQSVKDAAECMALLAKDGIRSIHILENVYVEPHPIYELFQYKPPTFYIHDLEGR